MPLGGYRRYVMEGDEPGDWCQDEVVLWLPGEPLDAGTLESVDWIGEDYLSGETESPLRDAGDLTSHNGVVLVVDPAGGGGAEFLIPLSSLARDGSEVRLRLWNVTVPSEPFGIDGLLPAEAHPMWKDHSW